MARSGGALQLILWCGFPTSPLDLFKILADTSDDDLVALARSVDGPAGRIAWAEYGKRRGFFDFEVGMARQKGKLEIVYEAKAPPIHDFPRYQ